MKKIFLITFLSIFSTNLFSAQLLPVSNSMFIESEGYSREQAVTEYHDLRNKIKKFEFNFLNVTNEEYYKKVVSPFLLDEIKKILNLFDTEDVKIKTFKDLMHYIYIYNEGYIYRKMIELAENKEYSNLFGILNNLLLKNMKYKHLDIAKSLQEMGAELTYFGYAFMD